MLFVYSPTSPSSPGQSAGDNGSVQVSDTIAAKTLQPEITQ